MKKFQLLFIVIMLLLSIDAKADDKINSSLNLSNPDVRKCLVEATQSEGWKIAALYFNKEEKLVMIFEKDNNSKTYISK